jgi:hypothetical protein
VWHNGVADESGKLDRVALGSGQEFRNVARVPGFRSEWCQLIGIA